MITMDQLAAIIAWRKVAEVELSAKLARVQDEWEKENPGKDAIVDMLPWEFRLRWNR